MAEKDTGRAMGTGGSGGIFGRKTELVADLTSAFKELNKELEKTRQLSADISANLKGARPGGSSNLLSGSLGVSTGNKESIENDGSQGGLTGMGILRNVGAFVGKAGLIGLQGLPTVQQAFEQDLLRARFGFYGGGDANASQMRMARGGTTTDPLDAARASMTGASMGLLPGLSNFRTIEQSAMGVSNLMPGVGLQGGMQATGALNQARNVNMLRMIGVNVRDANGMMRGFDDIATDLWGVLNRGKAGSGKITKQDIAFSLQPGMSLDSMLNQYFGNDPILRQTVISKLMDMAGAGGPTSTSSRADKERLAGAGATTESVLTSSDRNAASLNAVQAVAPSVLEGFQAANKLLEEASNKVAELARNAGILGDVFRGVLTGKGFVDTIGSSANGAGAAAMGLLGNTVGSFAGSLLGTRGKLGTATMANASAKLGGLGKLMPKTALGFLARAGLATGTYMGLEKLQGFLNDKGEGLPDWLQQLGNFAFDTGQGALTGLLAGGIPGLLAGTVAGGAGAAFNPYGEGGGDDGSSSEYMMPFSGSFPVTSPYGAVRHLTLNNGKRSPTWGKPHGGIDYGTPTGTPIFAVTDGDVQTTPYDSNGFGHYVKMVTGKGDELYYAHLDRKAVSGGSKVKAGEVIGYSGASGGVTGPHLHFEVRRHGNKIDPAMYLSGAGSSSLLSGASPSANRPTSNMSPLRLSSNLSGLIFEGAGGSGIVAPPEFGMNGKSNDSTQTINYGGVTINFNMPNGAATDVKAIANEVKRVLSYDNIREKAVNR
jgi:murein DD-endopeptidase MepM/ murein hydrolase activator NlpD